MKYNIILPDRVYKNLSDIPKSDKEEILLKILRLEDDPLPLGTKKLKGFEKEFRLRIGDYRIRYEIIENEKIIIILNIAHRKDIYKKK